MKKILIGFIFVLGIVGGYFFPKVSKNYGAISVPDAPYLFQTTLLSAIGTTDSSMTLTLGTLKSGSALSGYQCFTIDAGTASAEYVCGTASSTSVTSLVRGIDPLDPATSVTALKFSHRRGADVRITDFPILQITKRLINGQDGLPSPLKLDTSISTTTLATNTSYLASVGYVNGVALQGAPTATTTIPGVVQIGTTAQIASATGMTGNYTLVPAGSLFSQTFRSATTVPVTSASGKIASGFIDTTSAYSFSGAVTFASATTTLSATTTIAASSLNKLYLNNVPYVFPSSQGSASTTLLNDGSGNLTWGSSFIAPVYGNYSTSTPVTGVMKIAHGLGRIPKYVRVEAYGFGAGACGDVRSVGVYNGSSISGIDYRVTGSCGGSGPNTNSSIFYIQSTGSATASSDLTVDSTYLNFNITVSGSPGTFVFLWEAY
jgi:hypothetical protein